jgi:hypothetical protein
MSPIFSAIWLGLGAVGAAWNAAGALAGSASAVASESARYSARARATPSGSEATRLGPKPMLRPVPMPPSWRMTS